MGLDNKGDIQTVYILKTAQRETVPLETEVLKATAEILNQTE